MTRTRLSGIALWALAPALGAQPAHPQTYGTSAVSYVEIPAVAFDSPFPTFPVTQGGGGFARYTAGCGGCMEAPLRLPSGAKIVSIEVDAVDTDAFDSVFGSFVVADRFGLNPAKYPSAGAGPADCVMAGWVCTGEAFADGPTAAIADLASENIVVDNTHSSYLLLGWADASSEALAGVIVGYVLQVSPPPATADFGDVPTNHPFFQFVEALYASGITGGCGNGNYCPNAPLTRGQMAVFLAKALGLQWQ